MAKASTIVWIRRDLRLEDNPALSAAARMGPVVPVFIWSPEEEGQFQPGRVSRWWLKQSLIQLEMSLSNLGVPLIMRKAKDSLAVLLDIVQATGASSVFYNHLYDPISLVRDHRVKQGLTQHGIQVHSFNGDLLYEPWEICDDDGKPFTRFENYWQKCLDMPSEPDSPLLPPRRLVAASGNVATCTAEELGLEDETEKSSNALLARAWAPGWSNADKALELFLAGPLQEYSQKRHTIDGPTTSLLSPHLHFGEISVRKVYHSVRRIQISWVKDGSTVGEESINFFMRSIGFREYSRYLCFNFPFTHEKSLLSNLKSFPWRADEGFFKAWRQGRTGYPLVDAGMRELWATGWLHNRVRVIVSSFCVKFLQLPWKWGMKYFWDTLLDADLESDVLGWQYISGSLPDGHELDRMDNPQTEGYKHDPLGEYVRRWLPELARLPSEWIHHPWDAPPTVLRAAGVELGSNYPRPIVDVAAARERLRQSVSQMWEQEAALKAAGINGDDEALNENLDVKVVTQPLVKTNRVEGEGGRTEASSSAVQFSSGSSRRDQMVPTFAKQLKACESSLVQGCSKSTLPEAAISCQDNNIPPSLPSLIRDAPQTSPVTACTQYQGSRSGYVMAPPPMSDENSTAESSSCPVRRGENRSDGNSIRVPGITSEEQSSDFGCVPNARQPRKYGFPLRDSPLEDKAENVVQISGAESVRGNKRKYRS